MPSDRLLYSIPEAAERLSLSKTNLRLLIRAGQIVPIRPMGERGDERIPACELERFVADRLAEARALVQAEQAKTWEFVERSMATASGPGQAAAVNGKRSPRGRG